MINEIAQNISPVTALPGLLAENRPAAVNQLVEEELPLLSTELETLVGQINDFVTETNQTALTIEENKELAEDSATVAASLANYQGVWTDLVAYSKGQSVSSGTLYYISKVDNNLNHAVTDTNYWLPNPINDKVDKTINSLTAKTTPIDADLVYLGDSVSSFGLKKLSWENIKDTLKTYFDTLYNFYNPTPTIANGSISFNGATNTISYTGIASNIEVGDVIGITGSTNNNDFYTVEVITNADNIIVNQAHANKSLTYTNGKRTKTLNTETSNATVKLISKYYNADDSLGRDWVNVTPSRVAGTTYPNNTNRAILVSITGTGVPSSSLELLINGDIVQKNSYYETGATGYALVGTKIPKLDSYRVNVVTGSILYFFELR